MSTHIGAKPGDIAQSILLPGDPMRAKYIAENFFDNPVCFNNVRNMLGFTGTYLGKRVSVMGTGMGIPSISIYATELMQQYDVQNLVRIGTCGSMKTGIKIRDIILAQGACTDSDINHHIFSGTYCPVADFDLLRTAYLKAQALGIKTWVGNVLSSDMFYNEELGPGNELWIKYGVLGVEMEAAALFTLAKKLNRRAFALLTVSDSLVSDEAQMSPAEREQSLNSMITIALETVCEFS
jgi:purine-nucleoside phosphorylase